MVRKEWRKRLRAKMLIKNDVLCFFLVAAIFFTEPGGVFSLLRLTCNAMPKIFTNIPLAKIIRNGV